MVQILMPISHFVARYVARKKYKISQSLEFPLQTIKHGKTWSSNVPWSNCNYWYWVYLDNYYFSFNLHLYAHSHVSIIRIHVIFYITFLRARKVRFLYRRNRNAGYNETNIESPYEDYNSSFLIVNIWTWSTLQKHGSSEIMKKVGNHFTRCTSCKLTTKGF